MNRKHVLCFAGTEEAIFVVNHVLLDRDDHTVVVTPNYQAAETVQLSICDVTGLALDIDNDWKLDIDKLCAAIRPNTKLVSINFPNNPNGKIIPPKSLDAIIEICREREIWLFSDEVCRLIKTDQEIRLPLAVDVHERAVSLKVMSKACGLPGLRIDWLACKDRNSLVRFERYKHHLSICCLAPSEVLATIALRHRNDILEKNRATVRANVAEYDRFFAEYPALFDWKAPDGGCVAFIRYRGNDGVEEFCRRVVEESGVLFLPSSIYRSELNPVPQDCMRVGIGRSHVPDGLAVLRDWMQQNHR